MASDDKWVKKYESYKQMDLDTIIQKREEQGEDTTLFRAVKENLPKIENLKVFLDKKLEEKKQLEEEKRLVEKLKKAPEIMQDMDKKIKEKEEENKLIESKMTEIDNKLKQGIEDPEEKGKLEEEKNKLWEEYGINQGKMGKFQEEYNITYRLVEENLGKKFQSIESIDKRLEETDKTIDKCNTICAGLVEGENINDIMKALDEKEAQEAVKPDTTKPGPEIRMVFDHEDREESEHEDKEKPEEERKDEARPREDKIEGKEDKEKTVEKEEDKKPEKEKMSLKDRIAMAFKKVKNLYNKIFKKEDVVKELKEAEKEVEKEEEGKSFKDDIRVELSPEAEKESKDEAMLEEIAKVVDAERHEVVEEKIEEESKDGIKDELKDDKVKDEKEPEKESNLDQLENSYLMAIAEHGERSPEANQLAAEIKLRKYVMKETGIEIGTKKDMTTRKEAYTPLPQDGKMTAALKAQDEMATRNDDDDAR